MSILAGKVTAVNGTVQAVDTATGAVRILAVGDQVYINETILTSVSGTATIELIDGELLTLARGTETVLDVDSLGLASSIASAEDVEALQEAILQGDVNLEELEAPAAGEGGVSSSNAGALNVVDRIGAEGNVTSGFDTVGVTSEVAQRDYIEPALTENQAPTVDVVAIAVPVEGEAEAGDTVFTFTGSDPENDELTYQLINDNNGYLELELDGGVPTGNKIMTQDRADAINADVPISSLVAAVEVSDGELTASDSDTTSVSPVNDGPSVDVEAYATFTEGEAVAGDVAFTFTGSDPENDELTYQLINDNNGYLELELDGGVPTGNIILTQDGADAINADVPISSLVAAVEVSDGELTASDSDTTSVSPVNDLPEAEDVVLHTDNLAGDLVVDSIPVVEGEGENTIVWTSTGNNTLFSNGQEVTVDYGDTQDTLVGTAIIDGEPTTVFTLSLSLEGDEPTFSFDQNASLMSGYTTTDPIDFGSVHGGSGEAYGFALFDDSGELVATAQATADGDQDAVNTNSSIMGVDNTYIDAGEALTIDFSVDSGTFTQDDVTYEYTASGVQSLSVTLDAQAGKTSLATYTIYGVDADGNEISSDIQSVTVNGEETLVISTEDLAGAVYIDKVVFGAEDTSNWPYQLSFDAMTTLDIDEDVSMTFPYQVEDMDGDYADASVTVNLYGGDEEVGFVYEGTDDTQDVFDMDGIGTDVTITNYDIADDVLEVSDVIEDTDEEVAVNTLNEYLEFTAVDSDGDGNVDDTQIDIASKGESDATSEITTIYIQDQVLDEDDLDDMNVDYQDK
ncbi:retention module-containing protein [Thiomicrorhabdus sp. zzn3]|uniref:retention module-containing protein n=1 Tax=Thiomicrorhabdus sp. zzn3 TaxID=3039775 RepID=UPI0024365A84|nr:retention module-containing protein [Thiomicrorhabdus sp. zzn3]MDG6778852.1 retention module-containing protein [Thiomicrorhabdus sp. zzn3]